MNKLFTEAEKEFLKENVVGLSSGELTDLFNKEFNRNLNIKQIINYKKTHKLKSNIVTTFKKKQRPYNFKEIGAEFISKDGYTYIKTENPNKWIHKQVYIYEKKYGKIPKNYSVIFLDGNKNNFDIDNLALIKNKDKLIMKNKHLIFENRDLTRTGLLIAQIISKRKEIYEQRNKS